MGHAKRLLARFVHAQQAVAAVEFALILPIMLAVYIGTMEASTLISMDRKIQSVAGAVGDLVARSDGELDDDDLEDYFQASSGIMTPYDSTPVLQVITAVKIQNGTARVQWSRQYQNATYSNSTPYRNGDAYDLPEEMIDIAGTQMVIVAEASYSYTPLFGIVFDQPVNLFRSNFYLPRHGDDIPAP